jgi:hypothetical protein
LGRAAAGLLMTAVEAVVEGLDDVAGLLGSINVAAANKNDKINLFVDDGGIEAITEFKVC